MRILVVGATGTLGAAIAASLHAAGHAVIGTSRRRGPAFARWSDYGWIQADLAAAEDVHAWRVRLHAVDAVVNAALPATESTAASFERTLALGAARLYEACAAFGVKRVVHLTDLAWRGASTPARIAAARYAERALFAQPGDMLRDAIDIPVEAEPEEIATQVAFALSAAPRLRVVVPLARAALQP